MVSPTPSWLEVIEKGLEFLRALLIKLGVKPQPNKITKESADKQVAHQKELFRKNHPNG